MEPPICSHGCLAARLCATGISPFLLGRICKDFGRRAQRAAIRNARPARRAPAHSSGERPSIEGCGPGLPSPCQIRGPTKPPQPTSSSAGKAPSGSSGMADCADHPGKRRGRHNAAGKAPSGNPWYLASHRTGKTGGGGGRGTTFPVPRESRAHRAPPPPPPPFIVGARPSHIGDAPPLRQPPCCSPLPRVHPLAAAGQQVVALATPSSDRAGSSGPEGGRARRRAAADCAFCGHCHIVQALRAPGRPAAAHEPRRAAG